ncbi:unnamed protein product [Effrenium voratum]|nr:unnamed protein product [Effrenium voratum]
MRVHVVENAEERDKDPEPLKAAKPRVPVPRFRSSWTGGTMLWNSEKTVPTPSVVWQWEHRTGYKPYDNRATMRIEDAFQRGLSRVRLKAGKMDDTPMELFFHDMIQFDPKTGNTRKIRRVGTDSIWSRIKRKANELAWLIETGRTQRVVFAQYEQRRRELHRGMDRRDYNVTDMYKDHGCFASLAKSNTFFLLSMVVVLLNSIWIGIEADAPATEGISASQSVIEHLFCVAFTAEVVIRFSAFKRKKNCLKDFWFSFDSSLVVLMVCEVWLVPIGVFLAGMTGGNTDIHAVKELTILRTVRLLRLTRLGRIARLLRAVPEVVTLLKGIAAAIRSVFFTLLLLLVLLFVFGVVFKTQAKEDFPQLEELFPNVPLPLLGLALWDNVFEVDFKPGVDEHGLCYDELDANRGDARGASRFRPAAEVGHCPGSALLVFRGLEALEESLEEEDPNVWRTAIRKALVQGRPPQAQLVAKSDVGEKLPTLLRQLGCELRVARNLELGGEPPCLVLLTPETLSASLQALKGREGCIVVLLGLPDQGLLLLREKEPVTLVFGLQREGGKETLSLKRWEQLRDAVPQVGLCGLGLGNGGLLAYHDGSLEALGEACVQLRPVEGKTRSCAASMDAEGVSPEAELLSGGQVLAFTGAGISKESGVPTYRDGDGLWTRYDAMEVSSLAGLAGEPAKVWAFEREFNEILSRCRGPNDGHRALAQLEEEGCVEMVVTQNVDGFHQAAGSREVLELHGSEVHAICLNRACRKRLEMQKLFAPEAEKHWPLAKGWGVRWPEGEDDSELQRAVRSQLQALVEDKSDSSSSSSESSSSSASSATRRKRRTASKKPKPLTEEEKRSGPPEGRVPICPSCRTGILKPDGVYFGESLDKRILKKAILQSINSKVVMMVGTRGEVDPAAKLPLMAKGDNGAKIIEAENPQADGGAERSRGPELRAWEQVGATSGWLVALFLVFIFLSHMMVLNMLIGILCDVVHQVRPVAMAEVRFSRTIAALGLETPNPKSLMSLMGKMLGVKSAFRACKRE